MEYAGVGRRFAAVLIDGIVFLIVGVIIGLLTGGAYSTTSNGTHQFGVQLGNRPALVALFLFFTYYVICESVFGKTLGKRAVGLRVVDEDGSRIDLGASVVRNLLRIIDGLFLYLVAAIAVWSSRKRQRLGDRAAHTYVVRDSGELVRIWRASAVPERRPPSAAGGRAATYTEDDFMSDLARAKRFSD